MAAPRADSYSAVSGGAIAGGRFRLLNRSPNGSSSSWPPGAAVSIPSVAGINAPLHCKVLDTGTTSPFAGYRYWMAFTPYPVSGDDTVENPSVVASNDGDTWTAPSTNPVEAAPSGAATGYKYYADPHIVLKGGVMYLFFMLAESTGFYSGTRTTTLFVRTSADGVSWSPKQQAIQTVTTTSVPLLAPSFNYFAGKWWMWAFDSATSPISAKLRTSIDLFSGWSSPAACTLVLPDSTREIWHSDVVRIAYGWAMLIADKKRSDSTKGQLWLAYADHAGLNWSVRPTPFSTAQNPNVYRSSLVERGDGFDCWITDWDARTIRRLRINDDEVSPP